MRNKILSALGWLSIGFLIEGVLQVPLRPWYDDGHIYRGDRVTYSGPYQDFYDQCEYGTVLSLHNNVAFVYWKCPDTQQVNNVLRGGSEDIVSIDYLRPKK